MGQAVGFFILYVTLLECLGNEVEPERHSLYYEYTGLSGSTWSPGLFQFTASGLLDGVQIDHYSSASKVKRPKQEWMRDNLPPYYWVKGTESRRRKEQWFKVSLYILMDRMGHDANDIHSLAWKVGCEALKIPDGSLQFVSGVNEYHYDGRTFLFFNATSMQWVAPVNEALPTKEKWDGLPALSRYTKAYLVKDCMKWLDEFVQYRDNDAAESIKSSNEVEPERHSLYYEYTGLSGSTWSPGLFQFTASGLLDGVQIDHYSSTDKVKRPKQKWMRESLPPYYWMKGTESRRRKEKWFKVSLYILMDRMGHDANDIHSLAWKVGCEGVKMPDGSLQFVSGVNEYCYDGRTFIFFNATSMQWVAPVNEALPTKEKWDGLPALSQYTKAYQEKDCMKWLDEFVQYRDNDAAESIKSISEDGYVMEKRGESCTSSNDSEPERHSLYYEYTALSKATAPGIFEFTAMGLLDGLKIDYYNSVDKEKVPQQDWMKQMLPADYWEKGTQSRKSKEQWFKVNLNILMERMRHNANDIHSLAWKVGCEALKMPDGSLQFVSGVNEYSYDGSTFLLFDAVSMQWLAPVSAGLPTKEKWNGVPILNQYTKGYLEKECVEWLDKFRKYKDMDVKESLKSNPPKVHFFAKRGRPHAKVLLTCMVTGFYLKDLEMAVLKSDWREKNSNKDDVIPNGDGTHQLRLSVLAEEEELHSYKCEITHSTLDKPIVVNWKEDEDLQERHGGSSSYGVLSVGIVLLILGAALVMYVAKQKKWYGPETKGYNKCG
ncbi:uncharacterized protein LOC134451795 [Engraulis encrasicolus]|uniref:uncharacterized protein LOC134451795 n=1 Tax=Engraulis encrasicolus TaxID=184585 RepID=UPI002FD4FE5F